MSKIFLFIFSISAGLSLCAQPKDFVANTRAYQQAYVANHEVVLKEARKDFRFFKPDENYLVKATFLKLQDSTGFIMKTSGSKDKKFFRYGRVSFQLNGTDLSLVVYQNEQLMQDTAFENYLFLPFTDLTNGEESYGGGRYLDLEISKLKNNSILIDFNKAYNPYCAYASGKWVQLPCSSPGKQPAHRHSCRRKSICRKVY